MISKGRNLGEVPGEDLNRIFISFSGVSFQGCGLYCLIGARVAGH